VVINREKFYSVVVRQLLEVIPPIAIDVTVVVCRKAAGQNEMPFAGTHTWPQFRRSRRWVSWELEQSFDDQLCQKYSYQKLLKSGIDCNVKKDYQILIIHVFSCIFCFVPLFCALRFLFLVLLFIYKSVCLFKKIKRMYLQSAIMPSLQRR